MSCQVCTSTINLYLHTMHIFLHSIAAKKSVFLYTHTDPHFFLLPHFHLYVFALDKKALQGRCSPSKCQLDRTMLLQWLCASRTLEESDNEISWKWVWMWSGDDQMRAVLRFIYVSEHICKSSQIRERSNLERKRVCFVRLDRLPCWENKRLIFDLWLWQ